MSSLPSGWLVTEIGEISHVIRGITFPASEKEETESPKNICCLRTTNIQREIDWNDVYFVPRQYVKNQNQVVKVGDILMSMANSYELVGKVAVTRSLPYEAAFGAFLSVLRPKTCVDVTYLFHLLRSSDVQSAIRAGSSQTVNIANVSQRKLNGVPVNLAPIAEQKRIADKLDTLLSRVDACRERLDRVPTLIKRFKQSVLAAATSGELTADWRGTTERSGWIPQKIRDVCTSVTDGDHQAPPQVPSGVPFITISAFNNGRLNLSKATRCVSDEYYRELNEKRRPRKNDILYSVTGSIGIPALVDTDLPFTFQRHVAILRPDTNRISSRYLLYLMGSEVVKQQALQVATGTAQLTIPLNGLRTFDIDLPTIDEQSEIVKRIERLFAFADRLEERLAISTNQLIRLTPALLAKAFRGELVPQDPSDEPAQKMLERLRTAKSGEPIKATSRGRKRNATT